MLQIYNTLYQIYNTLFQLNRCYRYLTLNNLNALFLNIVNSRYSGHAGDGHLASVIAGVRSNGVRTKFPNFSVYRMSVVNNSVFGLKCLVYSDI